jgi:hypothetical protein
MVALFTLSNSKLNRPHEVKMIESNMRTCLLGALFSCDLGQLTDCIVMIMRASSKGIELYVAFGR